MILLGLGFMAALSKAVAQARIEREDLRETVAEEAERRLQILGLLYQSRRDKPDDPGMSVLELAAITDLPREQLLFTVNYLREKELILQNEKTDLVITAAGMDLVEESYTLSR